MGADRQRLPSAKLFSQHVEISAPLAICPRRVTREHSVPKQNNGRDGNCRAWKSSPNLIDSVPGDRYQWRKRGQEVVSSNGEFYQRHR